VWSLRGAITMKLRPPCRDTAVCAYAPVFQSHSKRCPHRAWATISGKVRVNRSNADLSSLMASGTSSQRKCWYALTALACAVMTAVTPAARSADDTGGAGAC